jgi:hypothetical protein
MARGAGAGDALIVVIVGVAPKRYLSTSRVVVFPCLPTK